MMHRRGAWSRSHFADARARDVEDRERGWCLKWKTRQTAWDRKASSDLPLGF